MNEFSNNSNNDIKSKYDEDNSLTRFDWVLLILIAFTYPFIAWCLLAKKDIIAILAPIVIFIVSSYISYAALRDFWLYYKEVTSKNKK